MKHIFTLLSFLIVINLGAQKLVSAQLKGSKTKAQITAVVNLPIIDYGAKFYKIRYKSTDAKGKTDTLSGLFAVPDNLTKNYPILFYQHGTSECKTCVPSRYTGTGGEGELGLLFAGLGFISLLPDYVGMGDGRGFQTYVHAATTVSASLDMLDAVKEWIAQNSVNTNDQLFITGYSQGGYASMALQKSIETSHPELKVTAASHLSGPYNLSGVMRNLVLGDTEYNFPAYLPNTVLGFNEINNDIFRETKEFFKEPYAAEIDKYYKGLTNLTNLNNKLISLLKQNNANRIVAGQMIIDSVKQVIISNPEHQTNVALRQNDVHNWASKAPTKIYYCQADDQVPYLNSVVARDTMNALGSINLEVRDVLPTGNHGTCFNPAITNTVLFFLSLRSITSSSSDILQSMITIFPNPTTDFISISGVTKCKSISIFDVQGKLVYQIQKPNEDRVIVDVSSWLSGQFTVNMVDSNNRVTSQIFQKY